MEAAAAGSDAHTATAVGLLGELLQVAVVTSNTHACQVLCSRKLCQQLSVRHTADVLMLAVQLLHFSTPWQRHQRLLVMQHVCRLFSRLAAASVQADVGGSSSSSIGMETRACVRQVLACAVQLGSEEALQQLLAVIPVQEQPLMSHTDLYVLQVTALRQPRFSPRIMRMLCGLRLTWHSRGSPALRPVSVATLYDLLLQALEMGTCKKGVSKMVRALVGWQPHPYRAPLGSKFDEDVVYHLLELAMKIPDVIEHVWVVEELCELGDEAFQSEVHEWYSRWWQHTVAELESDDFEEELD
jgi:hypothetical protein